MGTIEENKAVLRRYYDEGLNGRNLDVIDEVFAATVVSHGKEFMKDGSSGPYGDSTWGAQQEKELRTGHLAEFPDLKVEYNLVAEGDTVASRWLATNKKTGENIAPHMHYFYRLEGGKIVEMWFMW